MVRPGLFLTLLALLAAPAFAQTTQTDPAGFGGLADEAGEEVNVTADDLQINENESTALFSGNVVIVQGTMELAAPELLAVYGEGGPSDLENFTATGGVVMNFDDQTVDADQAFYDFAQRILTFTGSVVVVNESGTVNADRLVIDTRAGTSSFSSSGEGEGGRVTSTFTPEG
ncbi:LptA/OstA family protein [Pelagibacterium mangrovi]|uniref:LptA/OstA family protein n=1 Tax=Pelagibacterium mangrovi TaxID=3119828 RepID=UPI002FC705D5